MKELFGGNSIISKILNSYAYVYFVAILTCLFWAFHLEFEGIVVLCVLITLTLVFCEDATPVMTAFIFIFFIFSDLSISLEGRELWGLILLLPFAGFIYNLIRFKAKNFRLKGFSFTVLVTLVPWLISGLGMESREKERVILCILVAVVFVAIYFLISATSRREGKKSVEYLCHVMFALGLMIVAQIFIQNYRMGDFSFENKGVSLGWGTRNPVATILAMVMPVSFYFSTKKSWFSFLFLPVAYGEYIVVLLLQSRGVTLFATIAMVVLMVYSVVCAKHKIVNLVVNLLFIGAVVFVYFYNKGFIEKLLERLLENKLDDNNRTWLWEEALTLFIDHPYLGVGFDYRSPLYFNMITSSQGPAYYHSTFWQILASFGVVGLLAYLYMYYWRYRVVFTDLTSAKVAILGGMVIFECYCFVDTIYFQPMGYFLMLMFTLCMEKGLEYKQTEPLLFKGVRWVDAKVKVAKSTALTERN